MHFLRFVSTVVLSVRYIINTMFPTIVKTVLRYDHPTYCLHTEI